MGDFRKYMYPYLYHGQFSGIPRARGCSWTGNQKALGVLTIGIPRVWGVFLGGADESVNAQMN